MVMSVDHQRTFRAQTMRLNASRSRSETLLGREYLVVPVTALVEGVLQGANSDQPELVRFKTFAKAPHGWNGRPLVMNHPQVKGEYVSANSPSVLEDWQIGFMFNTKAESSSKSLETEAWVDVLRCEELGGEAEETLNKLQANEDMEISTGLFTEVDTKAIGTFTVNGKKKGYKGEWTNVLPDHLAILSDSPGACSIADGCGTKLNTNAQEPELHANCDGECTCGGGKVSTAEETPQPQATVLGRVNSAFDSARALVLKALNGGEGDGEAQRNVDGQEGSNEVPSGEGAENPVAGEEGEQTTGQPGSGSTVAPEEPTPAAELPEAEQAPTALSAIMTHSVAPELVFSDVEKQVRAALRRRAGIGSWYCILITQDHVVYTAENYGYYYSPSYIGNGTYRLAYDCDAEGNVTFTGEPEEVNVITKVIPVTTGALNVNSGDGEIQPEVEPMAEEANTAAPAPAPASGASTPPEAAPKVQSVDDYINSAPPEMQEMLREGLRMQAARRESLITGIKANSSSKLTDDQLKAFDTPTLESIAALAGVNTAPDYSGRAPAGSLQVNRQDDTNGFVEAPDVFAAPKPANTSVAA